MPQAIIAISYGAAKHKNTVSDAQKRVKVPVETMGWGYDMNTKYISPL